MDERLSVVVCDGDIGGESVVVDALLGDVTPASPFRPRISLKPRYTQRKIKFAPIFVVNGQHRHLQTGIQPPGLDLPAPFSRITGSNLRQHFSIPGPCPLQTT